MFSKSQAIYFAYVRRFVLRTRRPAGDRTAVYNSPARPRGGSRRQPMGAHPAAPSPRAVRAPEHTTYAAYPRQHIRAPHASHYEHTRISAPSPLTSCIISVARSGAHATHRNLTCPVRALRLSRRHHGLTWALRWRSIPCRPRSLSAQCAAHAAAHTRVAAHTKQSLSHTVARRNHGRHHMQPAGNGTHGTPSSSSSSLFA